MIEDSELRAMFKVECEEHLQRLDNGLLLLEKNPADRQVIEELFREAHSVKGASRMLGLGDIEMVAHRLEDILGLVRQDKLALAADIFDRLARGVEAIRKLVREATDGTPAALVISEVLSALAQLQTVPAQPAPSPRLADEHLPPETASPQHPPHPPEPPVAELSALPSAHTPQADNNTFRIATIRVDTKKLDLLMTQLGELTVTKNRIANRRAALEEILSLSEGLSHECAGPRQGATLMLHPALAASQRRTQEQLFRLEEMLGRFHRAIVDDSEQLDFICAELEEKVRAMRLLPVSTIFGLFERTVRDLSREQGKEAELIIEGSETTADKRIIEEMKDPLMHMIRNAIDHGIEPPAIRQEAGKDRIGRITLCASQTATHIVIEVSDDGRGMDAELIRQAAAKRQRWHPDELAAMDQEQLHSLIFVSGLSTNPFVSEVSGRGVGLDVVRKSVEQLKGTIQVESQAGKGCSFRARLPITLATTRVFIMEVDGIKYALPVEHVEVSCQVERQALFTIEGHQSMIFAEQAVSVIHLADLLELPAAPANSPSPTTKAKLPCIVIRDGEMRVGLLVDQLLDEQEIVFKPQGAVLKRIRNVSGATILGTGEVCMVLNAQDILKSVHRLRTSHIAPLPMSDPERKKVILLAEDSITTRAQEKRILEGAGYEVVTAVDGLEAFNQLGSRNFDAVVSDIMMPNMDGLSLTAKIREDKRYKGLPVILVTSLASDEDKRRGIEAGANAYLPKPAFDQTVLLDMLKRLA